MTNEPARKMSDPDTFGYRGNPWTLAAAIAGVLLLVLGGIVLGGWATTLGVMLITAAVLLAGLGWLARQHR